jgi:hypothetical protein
VCAAELRHYIAQELGEPKQSGTHRPAAKVYQQTLLFDDLLWWAEYRLQREIKAIQEGA